MKYFNFISVLFCLFFYTLCNGQNSQVYIFQYKNTQSTANIFTDYFIVLEKENNKFTGYFYGDTDVFVDAREGYIAAYFVKKIDNLMIDFSTEKISFEVNVSNDDFLYGKYYNPIPLSARSTAEAQQKGYKKWGSNLGKHLQRKFSGFLSINREANKWTGFTIYNESNKERLGFSLKILPKNIKNLDFITEQSFMEVENK